MKLANKIVDKARVVALHPIHKKSLVFNKHLVLKDQSGWNIIPLDEIFRCEADSNYSKVIRIDGKVIYVCITLKELESMLLNGKFIRPHQSHLISVAEIRRIDKQDGIILSDGTKIPFSRRRKIEILKYLSLI